MHPYSLKKSGRTVIENAVRGLRYAIMLGRLTPGQKLVEADLVAALNISRPSLREALRVLEAERLVQLIPNRGPFVANLGRDEVEEIHEIWALLTGEAVYRFVVGVRENDFHEIERAADNIQRSLPQGTVLKRVEAINRFFGLILSKSGNAILAEMVGSLVSRINFLRARSLSDDVEAGKSCEEIGTIARRICRRDAEGARAATHAHIGSVCSAALQVHAQPAADTPQFAELLRGSIEGTSASWYESTMIGRPVNAKKR